VNLVRLSLLCIVLAVAGCATQHPSVDPSVDTISAPNLGGPWTTDPGKFTFTVIGDRTDEGDKSQLHFFDRAMEEIALQRPDFVITVGDQIQGYTEDTAVADSQWTDLHNRLAKLPVPFIATPGNHDITGPVTWDRWTRNVGPTYYSFVYKNCLFIVLHTDEDWGADHDPRIGSKQAEWARDVIEDNPDVRHTFLFMHKLSWDEKRAYVHDWRLIEQALENRAYTAFAGHWHSQSHSERNGNHHYVVGTTGGSAWELDAVEMGSFQQYRSVTVDGDSVYVATHEIGHVWPHDVADPDFRQAVYSSFTIDANPVGGFDADTIHTTLSIRIDNPLDVPLRGEVYLHQASQGGWRYLDGDTVQKTIAPGGSGTIDIRMTVPGELLIPPPHMQFKLMRDDEVVFTRGMILPLCPDSSRLGPDEWDVVGPFASGDINRELCVTDPQAGMPVVYAMTPPVYDPNQSVVFGDLSNEWRKATEISNGRLDLVPLYGRGEYKVAFATCGIYSPRAQRVYGSLSVNDYAELWLNGERISDPVIFALGYGMPYFAMELAEGWNTLVVKSTNLGSNWNFQLEIADVDTDIRFGPTPTE
jgi:hypothetical protein